MEGLGKANRKRERCLSPAPMKFSWPSPAFSLFFHPDKEQRVWAADLQVMIAGKSKLCSNYSYREPSREVQAETFLLQFFSLAKEYPCPLLGSGREKDDFIINWGMELAPRCSPWILSLLFKTIIWSLVLLAGRWEPGKSVRASQASGSTSIIAVDVCHWSSMCNWKMKW